MKKFAFVIASAFIASAFCNSAKAETCSWYGSMKGCVTFGADWDTVKLVDKTQSLYGVLKLTCVGKDAWIIHEGWSGNFTDAWISQFADGYCSSK